MAYIGPSIETGFRQRFVYTATAGQTSFSGNDSVGISLTYTDSEYLDVYQNGVLLVPGSDYAATTGTTVVLVTGASLNDKVEMIAYQAFGVADTVSRADGGAFGGAVSMASTLTVTDDANFDSGTLFVDASANKVGVGTTAPSRTLDVHAGGDAAPINIRTTQALSLITFDNSSDTSGNHLVGFNADDFVVGDTNITMTLASNGTFTLPNQPSFSVNPASAQNNIAANESNVEVVFGTENYDVGGNFASNTFTAPVTGKYLLTTNIYTLNLDSAATYYVTTISTSNRTYLNLFDPDFGQDAVYWTHVVSAVADMDANDTAKVLISQSGGTAQTDIQTSSRFTGILIG